MIYKFNQIAEQLQQKIDRGEYRDRLPAEPELARQFGTTTLTLRKALNVLDRRGSIRKVPCVGTFVNTEKRRRIRIASAPLSGTEINDKLQTMVKAHFSRYELEFVDWQQVASPADFDLIRTSATSQLSYHDGIVPFPREIMEQYLSSGDYFAPIFNVHRIDDCFYAMPFLYSPAVLQINRQKLAGFGRDIGPYDLDLELLLELRDFARRSGCPLWDRRTIIGLLRCLVFGGGGPDARLADLDPDRVRENCRRFWPLFDPELIAARSENALLIWVCRQTLPADFSPDRALLAAYPAIGPEGRRLTITSGEFLMLSGRSSALPEAIEVAEYFLSPAVQRLIGEYRRGLPVLKSAAFDSLDSRVYHDDLFFNETRNMMTNNAVEREFLLRLEGFAASLIEGRLAVGQLLDFLAYEIEIARHNTLSWHEQFGAEMAGM